MGCCPGILIISVRHMYHFKACVGGFVFEHKSAIWTGVGGGGGDHGFTCGVCLGLDGRFFPEQGQQLLLSLDQSLVRSDITAISAGPQRGSLHPSNF